MAKVELTLLDVLKGSAGDAVFRTRKYGQVEVGRTRKPTDFKTTLQFRQRWLMDHASDLWHALPEDKREVWRARSDHYNGRIEQHHKNEVLRHLAYWYPFHEGEGYYIHDVTGNGWYRQLEYADWVEGGARFGVTKSYTLLFWKYAPFFSSPCTLKITLKLEHQPGGGKVRFFGPNLWYPSHDFPLRLYVDGLDYFYAEAKDQYGGLTEIPIKVTKFIGDFHTYQVTHTGSLFKVVIDGIMLASKPAPPLLHNGREVQLGRFDKQFHGTARDIKLYGLFDVSSYFEKYE